MKNKKAVWTFGRFNPPHKGHGLVFDKMKDLAAEQDADLFIVTGKTHSHPRNPLSFDQKRVFIESMFGVRIFYDKFVYDSYSFARWLVGNNYTDVTMVLGDDRTRLYTDMKEYVNHPDPEKSFPFNTFELVSAGTRVDTASDVTGMSATKVRQAVEANDFDLFETFMPVMINNDITKQLFKVLK